MSFYAQYIAYFEQLARKHKSILHTDEECHFTPISTHDFKAGAVSKIKFPHLLLLKPEYTLVNDKAGNLIKKYSCSLMLLDKFSEVNSTVEQKNTIIDNIEEINDQIIARMLDDTYDHNEASAGLFHATPETSRISGFVVGGNEADQYLFGSAGFFLQFEIFWPIDATSNPAKWNP